MILKGVISKLNIAKQTAEVTLPEYDDVVTAELPFYNRTVTANNTSVGDFVIIVTFNDDTDFQNGVII